MGISSFRRAARQEEFMETLSVSKKSRFKEFMEKLSFRKKARSDKYKGPSSFRKKARSGGIEAIVILSVVVAALVGWAANLLQLISYALSNPALGDVTFLWVVKLIGVFVFPIGVVCGWIGLF